MRNLLSLALFLALGSAANAACPHAMVVHAGQTDREACAAGEAAQPGRWVDGMWIDDLENESINAAIAAERLPPATVRIVPYPSN